MSAAPSAPTNFAADITASYSATLFIAGNSENKTIHAPHPVAAEDPST